MPDSTPPRPRSVKWMGWKRDIPDLRDKLLPPPPSKAPPLPPRVDLTPQFPEVYNQGELGSCTANAIGGVLQFIQRKQQEEDFISSRLFIYYNERVIEGSVDEDAGAMIRDGIKSVVKQGAPPETEWPYDISRFAEKPPPNAYAVALQHQALKYERVRQNEKALMSTLAAGYPIVFGFTVYESFESDEVAKTGNVPMPGTDEGILGGHAVVLVGYDKKIKRFKVRNSWGNDWGDNGYFTMSFDYLTNNDLSSDFWSISKVE